MHLARLVVEGFRNLRPLELDLAPSGLVLVSGANGQGKTNLLEAIGYVLTLDSLRRAQPGALVAAGEERALLSGSLGGEGDPDRSHLVGVEITRRGRTRTFLDRKPLGRASDLAGLTRALTVTPDDLAMVQAGPEERRRFLDGVLVGVAPGRTKERSELERAVRQRNALLRQLDGRIDEVGVASLDVWDERLARVGERWAAWREEVVVELERRASAYYSELAGEGSLDLRYVRSWTGALGEALAAGRREDLARGQTLRGPHRDDLEIEINGLAARSGASRGEQRSAMLSLKLAEWELVSTAAGWPAVVLLDDVLSELDAQRAARLLALLPPCQTVLTTAAEPDSVSPELSTRVAERLVVVGGTVSR